MDFGVVGLDGFVCSDTGFASDPETKLKWYGSGFNKQQRSNEDDWRDLKMAKTSETMAMQRSNGYGSLISDGQQMLSFSAPNSHSLTGTLPYYHQTSTAYAGRNTGYGSCSNMHGVLRGPFTSSQWMELEHQALIYKYITANAPVPSNLLIPIRKALESAGFSNFPGGNLKSTTLGWGGFHLGFANTDPEPGRCRRTDGKKWRCSRDAVADQKYCERHINRGRHRSRKPVEGQSGHAVPGPTTAAKLMPLSSSTSSAVAAVVAGGGSNSGLHHHQLNNLQPGAIFPVSPHLDRSFPNKAKADEKIQNATGPILSSTIGLKENQFSIPKHHNLYEESLRTEFGLVYSDSLLNPLHNKSSSLMSCGTYTSPQDPNHETKSQNSLRQFMDDWPKNQSSTSSPTNETVTLSPLRLSREFDSAQMGLGVGLNEQNQKQANWAPVSWENSMGGPLGEVLHSTSNGGECMTKNISALNLMTDAWDSSSPQMTSSPTGVLQKTTFRSLSNSSAGSSPRTENNSLLGSTLLCLPCNRLAPQPSLIKKTHL